MPVAKMLQKTFDSWEDLGKDYLIGHEFWSSQSEDNDRDRLQATYQELLNNDASPWKLCPWSINLNAEPPAEIPKKITVPIPPQQQLHSTPSNFEKVLKARRRKQLLPLALVGGGIFLLVLAVALKFLIHRK